jgi:Chalcone isomerase-like
MQPMQWCQWRPFFARGAWVVASMVWGASCAAALETGGIKVEAGQTVRSAALQLNGAGVRYKTVFKVYTAALYLEKKASTPEEVLQLPGTKRLSLTLLREIDADELGRLFIKGVEANVPSAELLKMLPHLTRMGQIFADQKKLLAGDNFTIDWIPGSGTQLTIKGTPQGAPFKEIEFFNGMMRIWLGKSPADYRLKEALLGQAPEAPRNSN